MTSINISSSAPFLQQHKELASTPCVSKWCHAHAHIPMHVSIDCYADSVATNSIVLTNILRHAQGTKCVHAMGKNLITLVQKVSNHILIINLLLLLFSAFLLSQIGYNLKRRIKNKSGFKFLKSNLYPQQVFICFVPQFPIGNNRIQDGRRIGKRVYRVVT